MQYFNTFLSAYYISCAAQAKAEPSLTVVDNVLFLSWLCTPVWMHLLTALQRYKCMHEWRGIIQTRTVGVTNVRQGFSIPPKGKDGGMKSTSYLHKYNK